MSEEQESTDTKTDQPTTKNGEESFNEEIKNYAKTAMNELLGMFGYDDEITSESVNNLEIKVPSTEPVTNNPVINTVPSVTAVTVTTSNTVTPSLPLNIPEDTSDDTPVIVKVEGNTSVNDIIRQQQNADSKTSNETTPVQVTSTSTTVAVTTPNTTQSTPVNITMTTQSQTGQPNLGSKMITGFTKPTAALNSPVNTPVASSNTASTSLSMFLKSTVQSQAVRACTWCKKNTVLKNFTFRDGTRILECRNICSQDCFEMAALSIDLNNDNIKSIQWRIRQLRGRKPSPAKQTDKPSQVKKTESTAVVSSRPARKTKPVGSQVARPLFNWEGYLKECRAKGAAASYFKQSSTPPYNGFKPGMKLEVADPRVIESTCLATVVGSIGPRIRFSFDGTDKTNDIWHMVDSSDIHPVGWSEANNCQLQAPLGFTRDPGTYQKFVATTLTILNPELIAPSRLFKKDPPTPSKNLFKTGMKLEAVDPKNQALVCVATVGDVDGDRIRIDFDGYLGSDYWCGYDSRNIFPVGWCIINGHPLQPPGKKKRPIAPPSNRTKKDEEPPPKRHKTQANVTSPTSKTSSSSTDPTIPAADLYKAQPTVSLYINHGCLTGRYLNKSKVAKLKHKWFGKCSEIIQPLIQGLVNCAHDQKTVFGFLKPGTGKTKITARGEGFETLSCSLQNIDRVKIFWRVLEKFMENLQCCENLISSNKLHGSCKKCHGKSGFSSSSKQAVETSKHRTSDNDVSSNQVCSTSPVKTWSVNEVIKYIESTELADHVTLFRVHEIDGRALLLLNRDMIMSYMGLKLGPAIKLLSIVDDLKPEEIVVE